MLGNFVVGKRSLVIEENKGTSLKVNLGILTSIKALRQTTSSESFSIILLCLHKAMSRFEITMKNHCDGNIFEL